ncbi:hypothetical protein M409DRAFT_23175 [Zasmidium cellare ATCC 36951]|uniref:deoxyribose-phosphate aldolase n=1 Tax=Zasmidium cellare ATCC 36951 TaxID=1080233 RepID=A0A6A6CH20_ZASCE|nr:uncharacterized protein M409DRAFT_23175 [Zasmidium cellare ATCC 36951]KAF2166537.1 hypothetical protein M409DRAFT_23175 [Zasmidium cellare ATCC 36951]
MSPSRTTATTTTLSLLAKTIDHSLLHPTLTDADLARGLALCIKHSVASACIKPYHVPLAKTTLKNTSVLVCAVIAFPHGNSATEIKVAEAELAVRQGADEVDMVVNVGKVLSGEWDYVEGEIRRVNESVVRGGGAVLKVIFENDYLLPEHIVRLCEVCSAVGVAFVKTSTGYGFVKRENGLYSYKGATVGDFRLMRGACKPGMGIKADGGVRTLDDLLHVRELGVARIGATATEQILEEAVRRGVGEELKTVEFRPMEGAGDGGY